MYLVPTKHIHSRCRIPLPYQLSKADQIAVTTNRLRCLAQVMQFIHADETLTQSSHGGLITILSVEFVHRPRQCFNDDGLVELQVFGDVGILETGCHVEQDLAFVDIKKVSIAADQTGHDAFRHTLSQHHLPLSDLDDAIDQFIFVSIFEDITVCARPQRPHDVPVFFAPGENENFDIGGFGADRRDNL
jgi:hypothetical protein